MVNAAKKCIPLKWKMRESPTVELWLKIMEESRRMKYLTIISKRDKKYEKAWWFWEQYTEERTLGRLFFGGGRVVGERIEVKDTVGGVIYENLLKRN